MKKFVELCKKSQSELKKYLVKELKKTYNNIAIDDGFVYAQGTFPVLLVAHMDTVHRELPKKIYYDKISSSIWSDQGIGGDDRCGIYMILEIIKRFNCSVLFCEDEEIGGVGAHKFINSEVSKYLSFNYMIEFDRRGSNDAVFYDCGNDEFESFITDRFYKSAWGTFSDISILAPDIGCAAVNLSCGYYKAHTTDEYVVMSQMKDSIEAACKILAKTTNKDVFEYVETKIYGNSYFDDYDIDDWYEFEYVDNDGNYYRYHTDAMSPEEAVGKFCIEHSDIPFSSITRWDLVDKWCEEYYKAGVIK